MKKFFRLVSVFAIAGVTFAYTSCTDYSEDIEQTNGRVTTLEGSVATLQNQVTSLQSAVSSLQSAMTTAQTNITDLQTALGKLQDKHDKDIAALETAYKNADTALKTELEGKITALQTKHQQDVNAINGEISALKTLTTNLGNRITALETWKEDLVKNVLPTFATKTELEQAKQWVEATFATKEALGKALEAIGALDGRLTIVETKLGKLLDETVPDIYTKIQAAHTAANNAQATASEALGKVDTLIEALGVYAEKGKLEETIAELVKTDSTLNAAILKLIEQDEKFKVDIQNLQNKDAYFDRVVDTLKAQDLIFDAAIFALQEKDKALDKVDAKHDSLIARLDEIKLNISDFQTYFDNALTEAVKDNGIVGKVIISKVEAAKTFLLGKIAELRTEVMGEIAKINGIFPERLTSIVFVPQYYVDGIDAIVFETLAFEGLDPEKENTVATDAKTINASTYSVTAETTAKYRFSPKSVGLDCADFGFVGNVAETRVVAPEAPIQIVGAPKYNETGEVVFTVEKKDKAQFQDKASDKIDIVALKATLKKGLTDAEKEAAEKPVVFSEYERVLEDAIFASKLAISDSMALVANKYPAVASEAWKKSKAHEYTKTVKAAQDGIVVYEMPYDKDFNLGKLVATCFNKDGKHSQLDLAKFGLYYKFSVAKTAFPLPTDQTITNQQTNIKCVDPVNGIYRTTGMTADGEVEFTKESIGRTPVVKIELMHGDVIVTRAFVKLEIVVEHQPNIFVDGGTENYVYGSAGCGQDPGTNHTMKIDVETMRAAIYRVCNISHEEFWNTYEVDEAKTSVTKYIGDKKIEKFPMSVPAWVDGNPAAGVATREIVWTFKDSEVGEIGAKGTKLVATYVLKNKLAASSPYPAEIKFQFEFNYTLPDYTTDAFVNVVKQGILWEEETGWLKANCNTPKTTTDVAENCWFKTPIAKQPWIKFEFDPKGELCIADTYFKIEKVYGDGKVITTDGVYLDPSTGKAPADGEVYIALEKGNTVVEKALNSQKGLQALVAYKAVLESGDVITLYSFTVDFIRPLDLNMPEGLSVIDAKTGGDVISFNFAGLLTDWRGYPVLPSYEVTTVTTEPIYEWKKVCSRADHALLVPEYQKVVRPAKWEIDFDSVTIPVEAGEKYNLYTAKWTYKYSPEIVAWYEQWADREFVWKSNYTGIGILYSLEPEEPSYGYEDEYGHWHDLEWEFVERPKASTLKEYEVVATGRSEEEAKASAKAMLMQISPYFLNGIDGEIDGCAALNKDLKVTSEELISAVPTEITIKYVKDVDYIPAKYETVPAHIMYSECNKKPSTVEHYNVGDKVGCWQLFHWGDNVTEETTTVPGQYWDFYGPISEEVVLDLDNITTDLPNGKLPADASVEKIDTDAHTLLYKNVHSPIQYEYHLFIPATVTYGWGTLNSTLTVLVKPVSTIAGE